MPAWVMMIVAMTCLVVTDMKLIAITALLLMMFVSTTYAATGPCSLCRVNKIKVADSDQQDEAVYELFGGD